MSLRALQDEAKKNKRDDIAQAAQRMWTSPQRLRKKELCSILNFAVRCDGKEIVQPLAALVSRPKVTWSLLEWNTNVISDIDVMLHQTRAINLLCVTAGKDGIRKNVPDTNLCFRGGGFDMQHREFFSQSGKRFRQPVRAQPRAMRVPIELATNVLVKHRKIEDSCVLYLD